MSTLPSGTVAMLFSDIEGSTGLLMRLGSSYADALDAERRMLRDAWARHSGVEMGTEGDSFFVVFASAYDAVAAAADGQRALASYGWPGGEQVRVRMGVHTGSPTLHDGGYVGKDVHRAARIAGAAHGGQVVVSEATAALVEEELPRGVSLLNLGAHQLKDIPRPEHLYQLAVEGLQADFPPLRTVGAVSTLPVPPNSLVGRDKDLAELVDALATSRMRLVTLTGPGGCGKTRLAIEVAHRLVNDFPDGVFFVPLVSLTASDQLWTAVAEVLDVRIPDLSAAKLMHYLGQRRLLLVLDNLEQLRGAGARIDELLAQAPRLAVIATSRRPLHIAAEYEHALVPLDLPGGDTLAEVQRSGAVQLFLQQARRIRSNFSLTRANAADIAALCRRLDGLPLALEIAAARTKLLSPHALLARLDQALDLQFAGTQRPDRHRTLRETIAWSEKLLTPAQQTLFHRMGVFAGGADLAAIAAIAAPDGVDDESEVLDLVTDLVDASLLTVTETADGEPRIGMLQTVKTYNREQMRQSGEHPAMRGRHARYYLDVAEEMAPQLNGRRRLAARARFELEHDNFLGALNWLLPAVPPSNSPEERLHLGLRLCLALNGFWVANGYLSEPRRWMQRAVDRGEGQDSPEMARCLSLLARKLRSAGRLEEAYGRAAQGLEMARRVDDGGASELLGLSTLASLEILLDHPAEARALHEQAASLAGELGDRVSLWGTLVDFAALESSQGNFERSWELGKEALDIASGLGHTVGELIARHNMAWALLRMGKPREAHEEMCQVIVAALELDEESVLLPLALDFGVVLADIGRVEAAVRVLGAADAGYDDLGSPPDPIQQSDRLRMIAVSQAALTTEQWEAAYAEGRRTTIEDALKEATAPAA